jgi:hypothetical protein
VVAVTFCLAVAIFAAGWFVGSLWALLIMGLK